MQYRARPPSRTLPDSFWVQFEALASLDGAGEAPVPQPSESASSSAKCGASLELALVGRDAAEANSASNMDDGASETSKSLATSGAPCARPPPRSLDFKRLAN